MEINPCISKEWEICQIEYKWKNAIYKINIYNPDKKESGYQKMYVNNELSANSENKVKLQSEGAYQIDYII